MATKLGFDKPHSPIEPLEVNTLHRIDVYQYMSTIPKQVFVDDIHLVDFELFIAHHATFEHVCLFCNGTMKIEELNCLNMLDTIKTIA